MIKKQNKQKVKFLLRINKEISKVSIKFFIVYYSLSTTSFYLRQHHLFSPSISHSFIFSFFFLLRICYYLFVYLLLLQFTWMGNFWGKWVNSFKKETRILMVGLDAAGKTSILCISFLLFSSLFSLIFIIKDKFKLGDTVLTTPTIGFNV